MVWNVGHIVYNHTDHLGNIRQNITKENGQLTVLREHNYYPFGLLHRGYNEEKEDLKYDKEQDFIFTVQAQAGRYKYKFQGQERQEDLDLGWDSFKYRNYDYAIGRFFNVDPLAAKYPYNSMYAFQENKLGLGRELEGLEMVSERSKDGKSVTIIYRVRVVNNSGLISQDQFRQLVNARKAFIEKYFSGNATGGVTLKFKVVEDDKATITWYYNDMIQGEDDINKQIWVAGKTEVIGNTQVNSNQVKIPTPGGAFQFDEDGNLIFTQSGVEEITITGAHEDGHVAGLLHPEDPNNTSNYKQQAMNDPDNLMHDVYAGNHLLPQQRADIIKNVESQQTNTNSTSSQSNGNSNNTNNNTNPKKDDRQNN